MSFSQSVKEELTEVRMRHEDDALALISGYVLSIASLKYVSRERAWGLRFVGECKAAVSYAAKLMCHSYRLEQQMLVTQHQRLNAKNVELVLYGKDIDRLMVDTGFAVTDENGDRSFTQRLPENLDKDHAARAFVRGVFLACGSVSDPSKGCHAELVLKSEPLARKVLSILGERGIAGKLTVRKAAWIVYLKEGEMVEDFLTFMGAGEAMLAVREQRMLREIKNNSNREVNCFSANMEKAAKASAAQVEDIMLILQERGTDCLNEQLYEAAQARLANPDLTLSQLAELLGIGKSAVNYRLRRLAAIAKEIKQELGMDTDY